MNLNQFKDKNKYEILRNTQDMLLEDTYVFPLTKPLYENEDKHDFSSPTKRYKKQEKLGEGAYGVVNKAYDYKKNQFVALKDQKGVTDEYEGLPQTTLREISILRDMNHNNIVKLQEVHCNFEKK